MPFKFQCPHCQQKFEADEEMIGQKLDCPSCGKTISINNGHADKVDLASLVNDNIPQNTDMQNTQETITQPEEPIVKNETPSKNKKSKLFIFCMLIFLFGIPIMFFALKWKNYHQLSNETVGTLAPFTPPENELNFPNGDAPKGMAMSIETSVNEVDFPSRDVSEDMAKPIEASEKKKRDKKANTSKDKLKTIERYRKAAEKGDAYAQYRLGMCYAKGIDVEKNMTEALKWYQMAAYGGSLKAQLVLGEYYETAGNTVEAEKWYRMAAEQGSPLAQQLVLEKYADGGEEDKAEVLGWYRKAAEQGDAQSQYKLGKIYKGIYERKGGVKDLEEAVKWVRKAANQGLPDAQHDLGVYYEFGQGVVKNMEEAVKWYRKAADQGLRESQFNLGVHYANGQGVAKNMVEAVKWYRKAAEQGLACAQVQLGNCYDSGNGVMQDMAEAVKWYRKAAEQGDAMALFNLGLSYGFGRGVEVNDEKSCIYMALAEDKGLEKAKEFLKGADTQYALGNSFESIDKRLSLKWYRKAASQGHPLAIQRLKQLKQ